MTEYQKVEVTWLDAGIERGTMTIEDACTLEPIERKNVGYLLWSLSHKVIICGGFITDVDNNNVTCDQIAVLPAGMVKGIRVLKLEGI